MSKSYYSLGLMSGTSMDGVDASIIQSDGEKKYKVILDKYFEYPQTIYKNLTKLRDKIKNSKDLRKFLKEETTTRSNGTYNKKTNKKISAIVVVHVFGNAVDIKPIIKICKKRKIKIIEASTPSIDVPLIRPKLK